MPWDDALVKVIWKKPLINADDRYYDLEITCDDAVVGLLSRPGDSFEFSVTPGRHEFQISGMAHATAGAISGGVTAPLPGRPGGPFKESTQIITLPSGISVLACKFTFLGTRPARLVMQ